MEIGFDVGEELKQNVYKQFTGYVGEDSVFPTKNGSPKILTKFVHHPYSYELLPEYERGEKKMPCTKAMNWEGKTYSSLVIRNFIRGTPVVEKCSNPRCISRLVIVPKLAPGQSKSDPNHGFRVCVNALVNKFLKPCASTIPLATDEITKLFNCKYFLQLDGMNAYWSIPVCEESKRLTAFHTPDGVYCWNRLLMGAKPSSAVQQSAYLEALDQYIDYDWDGNIRKCLLDKHGKRLLDSNGSPKTLRHKFAVYCDDIAAGANSLDELYDLYEALLCCCAKAGIQVKASKVKFGMKEVTFHNYTISEHGVTPKDPGLHVTTKQQLEYLAQLLTLMIAEDSTRQLEPTLRPDETKLVRSLPVISECFLNPLALRLKTEQEAQVRAMATPKDNPWLTKLQDEYLGKILYDGGYFRVFAIQFVPNKNTNRFPCWEATTEPVFEDDKGDFVVHDRHVSIGKNGTRTLLKSSMVGFALAEYSNGDTADPVSLPYAASCITKFLSRQARTALTPPTSARKRPANPRVPSTRSSKRNRAVSSK